MTVTRETAPPTETRVLMVLDSFNFGGAENLIAELGRFRPAGLELSVASLAPENDGRTAMLDRLAAAGLRPRFLSVRRLLDPAGFVRLVRTLRHAQADVIHAHLGYCAILVTLAARLAGKPVVTTLHVSPQDDARFGEFIKERLAVRIPSRLGRLVLVSHHLYHRYAERHGPARDTWRVIPNAIDVERYTPARGSAGSDRPVWAVVAALRPKKNHLDLIRAWTEVAAVHPDATLLVVGDGPCRAELERAVAEAGLTRSVQFLGSRTDVCEILQGVDGVVSASVDEALPTALIEAAACGSCPASGCRAFREPFQKIAKSAARIAALHRLFRKAASRRMAAARGPPRRRSGQHILHHVFQSSGQPRAPVRRMGAAEGVGRARVSPGILRCRSRLSVLDQAAHSLGDHDANGNFRKCGNEAHRNLLSLNCGRPAPLND